MTRRLAHRELRNRSSEVLREVAGGAIYEITNHGEVVAVLSPPPAGLELPLRRARTRGGFSRLPRARAARSTGDVLDDLRRERE